MNYSASGLDAMKSKEKTFNEFFLVVRNILQEQEVLGNVPQHWNSDDLALHNNLLKAQDGVDAALKDNFDTPTALNILTDLIADSNKYIMANKGKEKGLLLRKVANYVTRILRIWGVFFEKDMSSVGGSSEVVDTEKILNPYLKALATFRSQIRSAAIEKKDLSEFLRLCDEIRDDVLPPLGVRIEDSGLTAFKLDNPETIMKEIADKKAQQVAAMKKKLETQIKNIKTELEELEKGKMTAQELFESEGYKSFDAEGLPNVDKDGKEITKSASKKFKKQQEQQQKLHSKYQEKVGKDADVVAKKQKELKEAQDKLKALN